MFCVNYNHPLSSGLGEWWLAAPGKGHIFSALVTGKDALPHSTAIFIRAFGPVVTPLSNIGAYIFDGNQSVGFESGPPRWDYFQTVNDHTWISTFMWSGSGVGIQSIFRFRGDGNHIAAIYIISGRVEVYSGASRLQGSAITANRPYHVAVTNYNGDRRLYIDGVLNASDSGGYISSTGPSSQMVQIAGDDYNQRLTGQIESVFYYRRPMSGEEIMQHYLEWRLGYNNLLLKFNPSLVPSVFNPRMCHVEYPRGLIRGSV